MGCFGIKWIIHQLGEKLDLQGTWEEICELGKVYGRRFFVFAVVWEILEDVVFPAVAWWLGYPWMAPLFWIFPLELLSYPAALWGFRMWDRMKGRIPWDPTRLAHFAYYRTLVKVASHQALIVVGVSFMPVKGPPTLGKNNVS